MCFDTLAEESPQALSSKTCVFKQLGSEFGEGGFNSGHVSWPRIAWETADRRLDDLRLILFLETGLGAPGASDPIATSLGGGSISSCCPTPYTFQISIVSQRMHYLRDFVDFSCS